MMTSPAMQTMTANFAPIGVVSSVFDNVQAVGAAWMLSSALCTTYSTTKFLKYSPASDLERRRGSRLSRATLLTVFRFGGSLALGLLAHPDWQIYDRLIETWKLLPTFAWPALFLFVANYSNSISLNRIGISLTYTSKCAIPLITVFLTVLLDGFNALPRMAVLLTLIPIGLGIATASWNHPNFELIGLLAAFVSCTAQSALNVTTKRIMKRVDVGGPVALRAMAAAGLVIASAMSIFQLLSPQKNDKKETEILPPVWLALMASTAYHIEYVLSFKFVKMVAPITYSASDAIRRLGIIITGHFMFGGPAFTPLNIMGIGMALGGALAYSFLNQ